MYDKHKTKKFTAVHSLV